MIYTHFKRILPSTSFEPIRNIHFENRISDPILPKQDIGSVQRGGQECPKRLREEDF
jgi:hypothetical protein